MHNCKATRERIAELVYNGVEAPQVELIGCEMCRSEFDAVKATLRMSMWAIKSATPQEDYWAGYHAQLRNKLVDEVTRGPQQSQGWLAGFLTSSIRVPVPVVVVIVAACATGASLALLRKPNLIAQPGVSVLHVPVEIPVVQEKIVTKVVYRKPKQSLSRRNSPELINSTFAKSQPASSTLNGFKPFDEVKLTVIKGGAPDEK